MAETVGFEPTIRGYRIHTFQACAFDHSATSPLVPLGRSEPLALNGSNRNRRVCETIGLAFKMWYLSRYWAALRALAFAANAAYEEPPSALKNAWKGAFGFERQVAQGFS